MSIAKEDDIYSRLDYAFARFLSQRSRLENLNKKRFETLIAFLSQQQHQGHTCIEISGADKKLLLDSGFSCEIPENSPQSFPLIIEENRLYLQRYWAYEDQLAKKIKQLAHITLVVPNLDSLLDRYYPVTGTQTDWQREATKIACQQAFTIITGGPGTGKTTTVCKTLAVLQELAEKPLLIALVCPYRKSGHALAGSGRAEFSHIELFRTDQTASAADSNDPASFVGSESFIALPSNIIPPLRWYLI